MADRFLRLFAGVATASLDAFLDLARAQRFDGSITIHFRGGEPVLLEAANPTRIQLSNGTVDKPLTSVAHSTTMR
jgi:hypothetical protein